MSSVGPIADSKIEPPPRAQKSESRLLVRQAKLARSSRCRSGPGTGSARPVVSVASWKVTTGEAYTTIVWGVGFSHEMAISQAARDQWSRRQHALRRYARRFRLPVSEATSRTKGSRRNLGDGLRAPLMKNSGSESITISVVNEVSRDLQEPRRRKAIRWRAMRQIIANLGQARTALACQTIDHL